MNDFQAPLLVGIDVGGSKMHIQIASAVDGHVLADEVQPNTGWAKLDDATRADSLLAVVRASTAPYGQPAVIVAGVHGNDSPEQEVVLRAPLAAHYPVVRILNDSNLLILAYGKSSGTGVIAGTGSSATATLGDTALTVGGGGWIFGDEGGAVGIVRDAARQVLDAYDKGEKDALSEALLAHFGVDHPHGLTHAFSTIDPRIWSQAAPLVFEAAERGSLRGQKIIDDHALALAELVALLQRRGGDVETIVCAGGVITGQPALFNAFTREVRRLLGPSTETALLTDPPVRGALSLAKHIYITSQTGTTKIDQPVADRVSI